MIKETIEKNAEVKVNSKEMEVLQKHFPSCFDKDGKFDIKVFEELIKTEDVDIKKEGYSLDFLGKSYARYLASLDSETVIVPDERNKDINSENIYIVGDNLDALQHLKYSYSERIKCIYIDPPYNTGSDGFVYNDKFEFTAEELAKKIGIEQEEAERVLNMQGKSTHSAWLTFMYPRLELARDLLSDDGVILISIDNNEESNLKLLCDEIFGESNYIETIIWDKKAGAKGVPPVNMMVNVHEYIVAYQKTKAFKFNGEKRDADADGFKNPDNDPRGPWRASNIKSTTKPIEDAFTIVDPNTGKEYTNTWAFSKESLDRMIREGRILWKESLPKQKEYMYEMTNENKAIKSTWGVFDAQSTTVFLKDLIPEVKFDNPKPLSLMEYVLSVATNKNDLILDFFGGSSTTAHAIMNLNLEDAGKRKYIMVQIEEAIKNDTDAFKAGYTSIDKIGRERIVRSAKKIAEENPEKAESLDLGFKTYYLKSTNKQTLDKIVDFDPNMPLDAEDIKSQFGKDAIIETWKIKDGYGFNAEVKEIDLKGYTAYFLTDSKVGTSLYLIDDMPDNAIIELVRKIEAYELNVDRIIEYGYAFSHATNTALRSNLKTLKNRNAIEPIIRY